MFPSFQLLHQFIFIFIYNVIMISFFYIQIYDMFCWLSYQDSGSQFFVRCQITNAHFRSTFSNTNQMLYASSGAPSMKDFNISLFIYHKVQRFADFYKWRSWAYLFFELDTRKPKLCGQSKCSHRFCIKSHCYRAFKKDLFEPSPSIEYEHCFFF